jgi:uracil-DNA glycosylase
MIGHICEALRQFEAPNVFNPWRDVDPLDIAGWRAPDARIGRLLDHFGINPSYLLIGEAPGYQGCHFSGVPFTNEALLCEGQIPRIAKCDRFTTRDKPWREPSATIVWRALQQAGIDHDVVMWNAFAFHPHKPGEPMSNRAPTKAELQAGRGILRAVLKFFDGAQVVAVGKVAHAALRSLEWNPSACLRHPSMGGASQFRAGLAKLVGSPLPTTPSQER